MHTVINEILNIITEKEVILNLATMELFEEAKQEETSGTLIPINTHSISHYPSSDPLPRRHHYYTQISEIVEVNDSLMTSDSEPSKRSSSHRENFQTIPAPGNVASTE